MGAGLGAPICWGFTGLPQPFINSPTDLSKAQAGAPLAPSPACPGLPPCTPGHLPFPLPHHGNPEKHLRAFLALLWGALCAQSRNLPCVGLPNPPDFPEAPSSIHLLSM